MFAFLAEIIRITSGLRSSKNDHDEPSPNESKPDRSGFSVVLARVSANQHWAREYLRNNPEINAIFGDIGFSCGFVPFKPHEINVHTGCIFLKTK